MAVAPKAVAPRFARGRRPRNRTLAAARRPCSRLPSPAGSRLRPQRSAAQGTAAQGASRHSRRPQPPCFPRRTAAQRSGAGTGRPAADRRSPPCAPRRTAAQAAGPTPTGAGTGPLADRRQAHGPRRGNLRSSAPTRGRRCRSRRRLCLSRFG